jgi:hypothetical protein
MCLDDPLCFRDHVRERFRLDGAHDGAGVVVNDGVPGQAEPTSIDARLSVARLPVDRISPQEAGRWDAELR